MFSELKEMKYKKVDVINAVRECLSNLYKSSNDESIHHESIEL